MQRGPWTSQIPKLLKNGGKGKTWIPSQSPEGGQGRQDREQRTQVDRGLLPVYTTCVYSLVTRGTQHMWTPSSGNFSSKMCSQVFMESFVILSL